MGTKKRVETVSLDSLSKSIDKAIALAAKRHGVTFGKENVIINWQIVGRPVLEMKNLDRKETRLDVATTIAKAIPEIKGLPVVTRVGKDVFVGVIGTKGGMAEF